MGIEADVHLVKFLFRGIEVLDLAETGGLRGKRGGRMVGAESGLVFSQPESRRHPHPPLLSMAAWLVIAEVIPIQLIAPVR